MLSIGGNRRSLLEIRRGIRSVLRPGFIVIWEQKLCPISTDTEIIFYFFQSPESLLLLLCLRVVINPSNASHRTF